MGDLQINSIKDSGLKAWAEKSDANGDGKLTGKELTVWNQIKASYKDINYDTLATVGGVGLKSCDVAKIFCGDGDGTATNDGKFDYTVEFTNGGIAKYDTQNPNNNAAIVDMSGHSFRNWGNNNYFEIQNFRGTGDNLTFNGPKPIYRGTTLIKATEYGLMNSPNVVINK